MFFARFATSVFFNRVLHGLPEVGDVVQNLLQTNLAATSHQNLYEFATNLEILQVFGIVLSYAIELLINPIEKYCDLHTCLSTSRVGGLLVVGSNNITHSCFGHRTLFSVWSARGPFLSSVVTLAFLSVPNWRWFVVTHTFKIVQDTVAASCRYNNKFWLQWKPWA